MSIQPVARERRHTLFFLHEIRSFSPVFLDTEVDMSRIRAHRAAAASALVPDIAPEAAADAPRYSVVTYVLHTAARVLERHPAANAAISGRLRPTVIRHSSVNGKMTLDKTLHGERVVLSAVLCDLQNASLDEVQRSVDYFRDGDADTLPEFAGARALHTKRWALALRSFRKVARPLPKRAFVMGTFAVTSLGHRPVDSFHSVGGTTITLGLGRVLDRPVVRDGAIVIAPVMRLSLAFDHRVIDGAEAADVLGELKDGLEHFPAAPAPAPAAVTTLVTVASP